MPNGPANRRFMSASPFNAPANPEPPAEQYVQGDRVTHDRYGLGRVVTVEDDTALIIDFGRQLMRIKIPCARMTKLLCHTFHRAARDPHLGHNRAGQHRPWSAGSPGAAGFSHGRWNGLPYCAVMAGLSRTSRPGFVSSSSATASRDFTKSENER
jgi:hypothetical protein